MCKSRVAITPVYWCWSVQEERHFSIFHVVFETISLFFPPQCKTAEKEKKRKRKGSFILLGVRLFVLGRMVSDCSEHVLSADGVQADRANKVLAFFFFFLPKVHRMLGSITHQPALSVLMKILTFHQENRPRHAVISDRLFVCGDLLNRWSMIARGPWAKLFESLHWDD